MKSNWNVASNNSSKRRQKRKRTWTWTSDLTGEIVSHKPKRKYLIVEMMAPFRAYSWAEFSSGFTEGTPSSQPSCFFLCVCVTSRRFTAKKKKKPVCCHIFSVCNESMIQLCVIGSQCKPFRAFKVWEIGPNGSYIFHWLCWTAAISKSLYAQFNWIQNRMPCSATDAKLSSKTLGCWKIKQFYPPSKCYTQFTGIVYLQWKLASHRRNIQRWMKCAPFIRKYFPFWKFISVNCSNWISMEIIRSIRN